MYLLPQLGVTRVHDNMALYRKERVSVNLSEAGTWNYNTGAGARSRARVIISGRGKPRLRRLCKWSRVRSA